MCLAYRPNVEADPAHQKALSDGWHKYFDFRLPPEEIICEGCVADNPQPIDSACPVRPCANERGLENCAYCADYGCEKLAKRLVTYEEIAERIGEPIPEEDRARFIAPYENKARLEALRAKLP